MKPSFPPTLVTGLICGISSDRKQDLTGICALGLPGICWNACGRNMAFLSVACLHETSRK